jgi:hypothetical protein
MSPPAAARNLFSTAKLRRAFASAATELAAAAAELDKDLRDNWEQA